MVQYIIKRDDTLEEWNPNKITDSIKKSIIANNLLDEYDAEEKSKNVTQLVLTNINGNKEIKQEEVQNLVEKGLMSFGFFDAAKNYILYREKRREIREEKRLQMDIVKTIDSYIEGSDWRINENANMDYSYQGLVLNLSGEIESKYCLNKYPEIVRESHLNNYFHIHDLSQGLVGYCSGWSLYDLLLEGFNLKGCCSSGPPKHFDSVLSQIINFIGTLQNEWAGAQAFSSIDTLLAPFVYYDNLTYNDVKQSMQRFIYNLNTTSRWGGQCPFSNLTFDLTVPKDYKNMPVLIGGKVKDKKYSDFTEEMKMINKAFLEVMKAGDYNGRIFSFPIPTYNITKEFDWDSEIGQLILEMTAKYGTPYFQNFINSDIDPTDVRSFCCRLQLDKRQIKKQLKHKTGGLFGSGELTGSVGVVTLNLPRYAYLSKDENEFFDMLEKYAKIAKDSLEFKRKMVSNNFDKGMFPWTSRYLKQKFDTYFSTIGVIGGHEACLNLFGEGIETEKGKEFSVKILNKLRDLMISFQEETGNMYNLEATPAEGTSYKLAKNDKEEFPDIITSGNDEPYYTNSTQLPVDYTNDVFFAIEHQNDLQTLYTGGTVFHTFIGEEIKNPNSIKEFLIKAFSMTKMPYLSITPTFSICETHGYISGEHFDCPECGKECEVYSRVVGYYRPVKRFNKGKKEEFKERKTFDVENKKEINKCLN
ncbi:MAG: ribonucleoside triphosphate reductase [Nanoarchaeota archaeon]